MDRIYLFVSPEEYPEVQASGACWDGASQSWYIGEGMEPARFARWLREAEGETPFGIVSEEAFVASAPSTCVRCGIEIEVVCIYCKSGVYTEIGDPIADFTVSNVWAHGGYVVTSGHFTHEAAEFAQRSRIELIDGAQLKQLIEEETVSLVSGVAAFAPAPVKAAAPACPGCGKPMVERTAKKGTMVGQTFWGCQDYPRCRRIVPKTT